MSKGQRGARLGKIVPYDAIVYVFNDATKDAAIANDDGFAAFVV